MARYKYHILLKYWMALVMLFSMLSFSSHASEYFPPELLMLASDGKVKYTNEDLSVFEKSDIPPGVYDLDLHVNNRKLTHRKVELFLVKNKEGKDVLLPCFKQSELTEYGIRLASEFLEKSSEEGCVDLSAVPYLKSDINLQSTSLNITVPQANIDQKAVVDFEKKSWDNGIPAVMLGYDLSQFTTHQDDKTQDNYYGNLRANINIGAWRYENYSTLTKNFGKKLDWNTMSNTLSTIIKPLNSDLSMGNTYTDSSMFDTVKIKGAKLSSNLQMLPDDYRIYAPRVIGLADSESVVTITQNGNVIYKKSLPAGPFNITDYYPISNGGNLNVNVMGTDGQQKNFIVPYSTMGVFERKGNHQYSFSSGQYDGYGEHNGTYISQLDFHYGLTDFVTLSAGTQLSSPYKAYAFGTGLNMGSFGAASLDMIHAQTQALNRRFSGNSFKMNYSKNILPTHTNLTVVGYKHFDDQYYSFSDAMGLDRGLDQSTNKLKTEYTASVIQSFPANWGQFNLSSTIYSFQNSKDSRNINMGYANTYNRISYNLYYSYSKAQQSRDEADQQAADRSVGLSMSIPLDFKRLKHPMYAGYSLSSNKEHNTTQNLNLNGVVGERQQASWGIYQGYDQQGHDYSGGISGSYEASFANMRAGYSYSGDLKNTSLGMSGGIVASKYGLLFSQPLQGTNALVVVDQAPGVHVQNSKSTATNHSGIALVSGLQPYRANTIMLNSQTIPANIEIENPIISNIVPTQGALILANFRTESGYKLLLNLKDENGAEIPFGAQASIGKSKPAMVSNFGQLYLLSHQKQGNISLKWKQNEQENSCVIDFNIAEMTMVNGLYMMPATCKYNPQNMAMKREMQE